MNEEKYRRLSEYFGKTKNRSTALKALHDVPPLLVFIFFPLQLLYLLYDKGFSDEMFLKVLLVPLCVFVLVTVIRYIVNAKRPYEVYDYAPIIKKNTIGKSFPSRHTASAFVIAMAFLYIQTSLGVLMLISAVLIGVTRVLSGVHFIRDVVFGALIGIIPGIICFFLI